MAQNYGHIPQYLKKGAVTFERHDILTGPMPTYFIGIVSDSFANDRWNNNRDRVKALFKIPDYCVTEIKARPQPDAPGKVDDEELTFSVMTAVEAMNESGSVPSALRIVRLGVSSSLSLFQGIEAFLTNWDLPASQKSVQFVALGDSGDRDWLTFVHWLCLAEICHDIQYYQTQDYTNFGMIDQRRRHINESKS